MELFANFCVGGSRQKVPSGAPASISINAWNSKSVTQTERWAAIATAGRNFGRSWAYRPSTQVFQSRIQALNKLD